MRRAHAASKRAAARIGIQTHTVGGTNQSFGAFDQRADIQINVSNEESLKPAPINCTNGKFKSLENLNDIKEFPLSSLPNGINCLSVVKFL